MWKVAFRMLGHPGRHSNAFLIPTASLGEHCLASALQVPLHLGDWCLDSVFSMKHLLRAFRRPGQSTWPTQAAERGHGGSPITEPAGILS